MNEELQIEMVPGHWSAELGRNVTFADLLAAAGFDAEDRPAPGTECAQCRMFGHWCPAKGFCGIYTLCLPCGAGEACEQLAAVDRMQRGVESELFEVEKGYQASECRSIAIAEEDRIVVEKKPVESAWSIKASLDPENLKKGLKHKQRVPLVAKTEPERKAARKERGLAKRIAKAKEKTMTEETTIKTATKVCRCGCGESYTATGNAQVYKDGHKPSKPAASKPKKSKSAAKPKPAGLVVKATASEVEMVSVRVPATALDKLILMLPAKMKASAIEKLLAELA